MPAATRTPRRIVRRRYLEALELIRDGVDQARAAKAAGLNEKTLRNRVGRDRRRLHLDLALVS